MYNDTISITTVYKNNGDNKKIIIYEIFEFSIRDKFTQCKRTFA